MMEPPRQPGLGRAPAPDAAAAHELLCELRTRIATQVLPRQYGVEASALESLWEIFGQARDAMKKYPGCEAFASATTTFLNVKLRPFTGKWHRAHADGQLATRDGADQFRSELAAVQLHIQAFANLLHEMAYGTPRNDRATSPVLDSHQLAALLEPVAFGIPRGWIEVPATTFSRNSEAQPVGSAVPPENPSGDSSDLTIRMINHAERNAVHDRRGHGVPKPPECEGKDAVGLALSGGGIRSATFCLGAIQVLARRGLLGDVDFLSTVSGGGYVGTFISLALGTKGVSQADLASPLGPDPDLIRRLRAGAKFLRSEDAWERCARITAAVAGMVLNWTGPLLLLLLAATMTIFGEVLWPKWLRLGLIIIGLVLAIALIIITYGFMLRPGPAKSPRMRRVNRGVTLSLPFLLGLAALCVVGWCLGAVGIVGPGGTRAARALSLSVLGGGALTAIPTVLRFATIAKNPLVRKTALRVILVFGALVVPIIAVCVFRALVEAGSRLCLPTSPRFNPSHCATLASIELSLAILSAVFVLSCLDINLTGPHRIYRDALARTFVDTAAPAGSRPFPLLKELNRDGGAPYHLLNATVNLPSSESPTLRDRRGDFFLFSKHYCGSVATGYIETDRWKFGGEDADVATAMAVSGAAVAPLMGLESIGWLSSLITFLNVRLGFWVLNPRRQAALRRPGFGCLLREMTGLGMSETSPWLYLTDGGHIENTGCYELLRRRCKFIICVDGEADPQVSFGGLLTLVRHVQIDFGIRIDPRLDELRRAGGKTTSASHGTLCVVHYPKVGDRTAATGLLLYLKLSMTGNESALIQRYSKLHPDFPYQTTLDQFFDQEQFEAYRQLGVHAADGFFSPALLGTSVEPSSVAEWIQRLAGSLLDPDML